MSDLISRQAAIDAINHELRCGAVIDQCGLETAHDLIEELPSADPKWTPCKKGLPKKSGHYLVQTADCITIMEYTLGNPHYHEDPAFVSDVLGRCNGYVVAWMPLPEPYQAERREE